MNLSDSIPFGQPLSVAGNPDSTAASAGLSDERIFFRSCFDCMNACPDMVKMLEALVPIIQHFSGYNAVGIRILDKRGGIPYVASHGFSREFLEQ